MPVIATPVGNSFRHISYIVFCAETGEAAAIDPFHTEQVIETARERSLVIRQILNTHEHWDHAGRNEELREKTGAVVVAAKAAAGVIERVDRMVTRGDVVSVGTTEELTVLETPGHTMTHISFAGTTDGRPFLLCGDTIFGAGVGNCSFGGHGPTLHRTVETLRDALPDATLLYPGHDYLARNLQFALHVNPGDSMAAAMLLELQCLPSSQVRFTTWAEEKQINPFLRRREGEAGSSEEAFLALRSLRDGWN